MGSRFLWVLGLWAGVASSLLAQLPNPAVSALSPMGGQRGTSLRIQAFGDHLDEPRELILSGNGLPPRAIGVATNLPNLPVAGEAFFHVNLPSDLALGTYEARFLGRFGLSNPRAFVVDELAERASDMGGDKPENAPELTLPALMNGRTDPSRINHYRFKLDAGQRIAIDISARDLDSRLEPRMIIFGPDGNEVTHGARGEGMDFKAARAGSYLLQVSDTTYRGGVDYGYRIEISTRPRIDAAWRTSATGMEMIGRFLPNATPWNGPKLRGVTLDLLRRDGFTLTARSTSFRRVVEADAQTRKVDPGFAVALADYPQLPDWPLTNWLGSVSLTNAPSLAIQPPVIIPGLLPPSRVTSAWEFTAHKGEVWLIDVLGHRLGLTASSMVLVQRVSTNNTGKIELADIRDARERDGNIGSNEYPFASRDSMLRWEVADDGFYRVSLRDLFASTAPDPRRACYLSIRHSSPRFVAVAAPLMPLNVNRELRDSLRWSANIAPGAVLPVRIYVQRLDGFDDPVQIALQNPPAGLHALPCAIERGKSVGYLWLTADTNALTSSTLLDLVATSGSQSVKVEGATVITPAADYNLEPTSSRLTRDSLALAIPPAGLSLVSAALATNMVLETSRGGKLSIPYSLARNAELSGTMKVRTLLDNSKEFDVDTKSTNFTVELEMTQAKLPPGKHTLGLLLQPKVKFNRYSPEARIKIEALQKESQQTIDANSKEGGDKAKKEQAEKDLNNYKNLLNTSEITGSFYSAPVEITVREMPTIVTLEPATVQVALGKKAEIKCTVVRQFGFDEAVELALSGPDQLKEVIYGKITVAKGSNDGVLTLETKPATPAGSYSLKLTTALKFNGEDLKSDQTAPLQVGP